MRTEFPRIRRISACAGGGPVWHDRGSKAVTSRCENVFSRARQTMASPCSVRSLAGDRNPPPQSSTDCIATVLKCRRPTTVAYRHPLHWCVDDQLTSPLTSDAGDLFGDGGRALVEDCTVTGNGGNGILIRDGTTAVIRGSRVKGNAGYGVLASDCDATLEANSIMGNRKGAVRVENGAELRGLKDGGNTID